MKKKPGLETTRIIVFGEYLTNNGTISLKISVLR